jgi:hypothetical protein
MSILRRFQFALGTLAIASALLAPLAACGGGTSAPAVAPSLPDAAGAQTLANLMGSAADLSVLLRPNEVRADAYWGPLLSRSLAGRDRPGDFITHSSGMMALNARQIELHFTVRDPLNFKKSKIDPRIIGWVGVIRGLAPLDPLSLRSGSGGALFAPPFRLPSGVLAYPPDAAYAREFGLFAPTLFMMPDGTALFTEQVSAPRATDFLARYPVAPAPLVAAPESLAGLSAAITTVRFVSAEKTDKAALTQGMVAARFGLRGGSNGLVEAHFDYASSDDAERANTAFQRACAEKAEACKLEPGLFREAKVERKGKSLVLTLVFSDALLRSVQAYTP